MTNLNKLSFLEAKLANIKKQRAFFASSAIDELRDCLSLFCASSVDFESRYDGFKKFINDEHCELWADFVNEKVRHKELAVEKGINSLRNIISVDEAMGVV